MAALDEMINHLSIKPSNKIRRICEPLYRHFGINHFFCNKTTSRGGFFSIGSHLDFHAHYFSSRLYTHSPFYCSPEFIQSGFYFYRNLKDSKFQETIDRGVSQCNVELCATVIIQNKNEIIRFGYGTQKEIFNNVSNLIANNIKLLSEFNNYFLKEAKEIVLKGDEELLDLPAEMGKAYYYKPSAFGYLLDPLRKCEFLDDIGSLKKSVIQMLSTQELRCLKYLSQGLNLPQIGIKMRLSSRTVESYLGNVKNKLNCYTKLDLIEAANVLKLCDLI